MKFNQSQNLYLEALLYLLIKDQHPAIITQGDSPKRKGVVNLIANAAGADDEEEDEEEKLGKGIVVVQHVTADV